MRRVSSNIETPTLMQSLDARSFHDLSACFGTFADTGSNKKRIERKQDHDRLLSIPSINQLRAAMRLTDELAKIDTMSLSECRAKWYRLRNIEPPPGLSANLLRGAIAYDLQAKCHGGLSQRAERKLARIALRLEKDPQATALQDEGPAPGARLLREWGGERHEVEVLNEGFAYRGAIYHSLSEVARQITGARWSGPRFFGLKRRR